MIGEIDVEAQRSPEGITKHESLTLQYARVLCLCNANLRTVLLQLGEAVVTHSSRLVFQVLQVVLVAGARLTHHLLHTHNTQ